MLQHHFRSAETNPMTSFLKSIDISSKLIDKKRPRSAHSTTTDCRILKFLRTTFLCKTANWQPVSTTNPQIRTVTYCTRLPTHLTSKTQFRTPNFSDSVGSAMKIQTLTPNATKCLISFPNVAILTASCLKHSIVSKTLIENPL